MSDKDSISQDEESVELSSVNEVTLEGQTISQGTFLKTENQFAHIPAGIYMRIDELYADDDDVFAVISSYANAVGAEYDGPALAICTALNNGKLSFEKRDEHMHD